MSDIFRRQQPDDPNLLTSLISSDLDVDRMDYLLRTAHGSGLPYGMVDVGYLIAQMRIDKDRRLCLSKKAMRAAEHLLLCRYFDYQQVSFHKTVVGFEWALQETLIRLIDEDNMDCSKVAIIDKIKNGDWAHFDDTFMVHKIREFTQRHDNDNDDAGIIARSAIERHPPALLADKEYLGDRDDNHFRSLISHMKTIKKEVSDKFGVPLSRIFVWDKPKPITKIGSHVSAGDAVKNGDSIEEAYSQTVRLLTEDGDSKDIMSQRESLMSVLADKMLYPVRLYAVLSPPERPRIKEIRSFVNDQMINKGVRD